MFAECAECVKVLRQMNDLATRAFISRKAGKPRTINAEINVLASKMSEQLAGIAKRFSAQEEGLAETLGSLDRVSRLLVDVSDLAVIMQPPSQ